MGWLDYKLEIARLYLEEDETLVNMMKIMEETHGFKKKYVDPYSLSVPTISCGYLYTEKANT